MTGRGKGGIGKGVSKIERERVGKREGKRHKERERVEEVSKVAGERHRRASIAFPPGK